MKRLAIAAALLCVMTPATWAQVNRNKPVGGANVQQTTDVINDCERRSNKFKKTPDKALGYDNVRAGQGREDQLNNDAKRLEEQMDKVGDFWNKDHSIDKTRNHVSAAIVKPPDYDNVEGASPCILQQGVEARPALLGTAGAVGIDVGELPAALGN